MPKCGKCNADIKHGELAGKCIDCTVEFHTACTQLGSLNFTKGKSKNWKCENCTVDTLSSISQQSNDSPAAILDKKTLLEVLGSFKVDLKAHTDAAVQSVIKKLDPLGEEVHSLTVKFTLLEETQSALKERCDTLERGNAMLANEVRSLRARLDDTEQHSRSANIEIMGLPMTAGENIYAVIQKLATAIGLQYRREDVSIAHRLRMFSKKQEHPPIICQFVSRTVKEQWMAAARRDKNLKSTAICASLQPSNIYINDHLTANNKGILGRARRLQREGRVHYAGFFNGKILVKEREGDHAVRILNQEDLDKFDR